MSDDQQLRLPSFEGQLWPIVRAAFGGGVEGELDSRLPDDVLAGLADLRVGEDFHLVVYGTLVSKKHGLTFTKDGDEVRTLTLALKIDNISSPIVMVVREFEDAELPHETMLEAAHAAAEDAP